MFSADQLLRCLCHPTIFSSRTSSTTGECPGSCWMKCWRWRGIPFGAVSLRSRLPQHCRGSTDASALSVDRERILDIDINDVHALAAAAYIHIKLQSARYPGPAPFRLPDPWQPDSSLTDLLTAIAALLARSQLHSAPLLHSAQTVHEVITEEYRILESVNYEFGTYTPGASSYASL